MGGDRMAIKLALDVYKRQGDKMARKAGEMFGK